MEKHTLEKLEYGKIIKKLAEKAATELGAEKARNLEPEVEMNIVSREIKESAQGLELLILNGPIPFGGIKDIRRPLKRAAKGQVLDLEEIVNIVQTLYGFKQIRKYFADYDDEGWSFPALEAYKFEIADFSALEKKINGIVDKYGEVRDDASPKLNSIRREIKVLAQRIREKMDSYLHNSKLEKIIQDPVVTIRGDRFVLPVRADKKGSLPGIIHDRSSSGQTVFVEPQAVVEMNNKLGSLEREEEAEIYRILKDITADIAGKSSEISFGLEAAAHLDFVMSKAHLAQEYNCSEPELNSQGPIRLKSARHPLLPAEEVVPIDFSLGDNFNTLVITGPNTGGKTVTLKTVGLLCLMAQSGLLIPVDKGSEVGIFSGIFADIGDEQSIEQSLSTFSSHLTQIVKLLKNAQKGDLVLLDEVGAGTDPEEGAALAMALLQHLHGKGILTIATTHYTELKAFAYTHDGIENAAVEFNVETLSPTYRLMIGVPGRSNALAIAARLGLSEGIIAQAKTFIGEQRSNVEGMISRIEKEEYAILEKKESLQIEKEKLEKELSQIKRERTELAEKHDKMVSDFSQRAQEIIEEIKQEGSKLLKEIRKRSGPAGDRMANEFNLALKAQAEKILELTRVKDRARKEREPLEVKPGQKVKIASLNQEGVVLSEKEDQVNVQAGVMKIWVDKKDLLPITEEEGDVPRTSQRYKKSKSLTIRQTLDLRGMRWEEGREEADKYLDDAYLAGLKRVEIIHGKGTGALRQGIHELLEGHHHVAGYRLGGEGEGGDGVTIVELRT